MSFDFKEKKNPKPYSKGFMQNYLYDATGGWYNKNKKKQRELDIAKWKTLQKPQKPTCA